VNERWVCKRCFSDNDGSAGACARCGLTRGAESSLEDQQSWATQAGVSAPEGPTPLWRKLIGYWWIPALVVVLAVGYFTSARRGEDGTVANAGTLSVDDLQVGDCFDSDDEEVSEVDARPCADPHQYEVFAVEDYEADAYPSVDAVFDDICIPAFEAYVGQSWLDSELYATVLHPAEEAWNDGDHEFICFLHEFYEEGATAPRMTGSMQGSGR
jgi:Septum formation